MDERGWPEGFDEDGLLCFAEELREAIVPRE
jgi:hypothetical protein